jgi:hypothetical protein
MGKNKDIIHTTAKRSWWDGRITAVCGATAESGDYQTDTWTLFGFSGPRCPACQRIDRDGKKR